MRREGRLTPAQQRALETLWPLYGLDFSNAPLDLPAAFGRNAPTLLEIGFGTGDTLLQLARAQPTVNFLGIEVHRPGVGNLLRHLHEENTGNVRVICADATEVLRDGIADGALVGAMIFFPDPWPKKRHHKRRLIQPALVELLARKLCAGAILHLATDWENYAQQMLEVLDAAHGYKNTAGSGNYSPTRRDRPLTKFEQRGIKLGHGVWDLVYERAT